MNKTSDAQLKAAKKYRSATLERLTLQWKKGGNVTKENLQKWAKNAGLSVNKYVITAIIEKAQRDGELPPTGDTPGDPPQE